MEYALLLEMHLFLYMVCSDELDIFLERKNSTLSDQDYEHAGWCGSWPSIELQPIGRGLVGQAYNLSVQFLNHLFN